jgi:hypothetical protein
LPIVLQQRWSMYLLTWTRELSTYLRSFFHSSACTLCSLSFLFYYICPSSILNSPRFHAYCYLPSFCLSHATNPWFNQVYPTGCSVGQANIDGPWPRQNVLERKRSFYPRLYIPVQGNYDRLHVPCATFLSFSTIYVLLQFLTLLASMCIAIFCHFVFLVLLPVYTFFLHTWLMPSDVRQNVCNFHYLRENIYIFSTCKK